MSGQKIPSSREDRSSPWRDSLRGQPGSWSEHTTVLWKHYSVRVGVRVRGRVCVGVCGRARGVSLLGGSGGRRVHPGLHLVISPWAAEHRQPRAEDASWEVGDVRRSVVRVPEQGPGGPGGAKVTEAVGVTSCLPRGLPQPFLGNGPSPQLPALPAGTPPAPHPCLSNAVTRLRLLQTLAALHSRPRGSLARGRPGPGSWGSGPCMPHSLWASLHFKKQRLW